MKMSRGIQNIEGIRYGVNRGLTVEKRCLLQEEGQVLNNVFRCTSYTFTKQPTL